MKMELNCTGNSDFRNTIVLLTFLSNYSSSQIANSLGFFFKRSPISKISCRMGRKKPGPVVDEQQPLGDVRNKLVSKPLGVEV